MPVGNSEQGVGLWGGQIMFTMDNVTNYIDWWHEPTPGEAFEHQGDLLSFIATPTLSIGLNDYWMISITQAIGYRGMGWDMPDTSWHHRTENTTSDFANAIGGLLGDSYLNLRYLVLNTGSMDGYRFFIGSGVVIPSKNTLTSDPFFLLEKEEDGSISWDEGNHSHRHFSISEGTYKGIFELQFFKKQSINPVFYGFALKTILPINESEYGFKPSNIYEITFTLLTNPIKPINSSIGANLGYIHSTDAKWNGIISPNSKSTFLLPGLSLIKGFSKGTVTIGIQKPIFLLGSLSGTSDGINLEQRVKAIQLSIGYRQILDLNIPFLN